MEFQLPYSWQVDKAKLMAYQAAQQQQQQQYNDEMQTNNAIADYYRQAAQTRSEPSVKERMESGEITTPEQMRSARESNAMAQMPEFRPPTNKYEAMAYQYVQKDLQARSATTYNMYEPTIKQLYESGEDNPAVREKIAGIFSKDPYLAPLGQIIKGGKVTGPQEFVIPDVGAVIGTPEGRRKLEQWLGPNAWELEGVTSGQVKISGPMNNAHVTKYESEKGPKLPGGLSGLRAVNEAKKMVASGEAEDIESALPMASESLKQKDEAAKEARHRAEEDRREARQSARQLQQFEFMMRKMDRTQEIGEMRTAMRAPVAAESKMRQTYATASRLESKLVDPKTGLIPLTRRMISDYEKKNPSLLRSRGSAWVNDLWSGKIKAEGDLLSIKRNLNEIEAENARLATGAFTNAGTTKAAMDKFSQIKTGQSSESVKSQLDNLEKTTKMAAEAEYNAANAAIEEYNTVGQEYGIRPKPLLKKKDEQYAIGSTYKIPNSPTFTIVDRDVVDGEVKQILLNNGMIVDLKTGQWFKK